MIRFNKVSKQFGDTLVLQEQSFQVNDREFFVLVGSSGSGKTTLLKMINCLIKPSSGEILLNKIPQAELDLREMRLSIGYVLQQIALFPNLTVAENIAIIPEMKKWTKEETIQRTKDFLNKVNLPAEEYMNRYPKDLSGGEQQRVGIVRALISHPKILLMDEPFSALDPISKKQLQDLMLALHREFDMTIVFVTHDIKEAIKLGDRVAILDKGQIIQVDTPEAIVENPANDFVASLFGGDIDD
ncbi:ABC transporter ATP-binding protein [Streptococcus porcinus]|uniref:ABC-type quaternary amine transporter n=2 Tax=Streptococcus porcinus TaxID=1340 RepID=A0A4V6LYE0_STRPO|nr:ABC transporter ATP-binding protein [Streptococcus porcinus]EGJ27910.1 ABC transporter, ATP-binding protein [Streptococcus porcinus str. Jelinkova 176]MBA2795568.1 ABC transporter ATP-binding protein [Streptococcus porcinus]SQG44259.1 glycine betaine ABC transporter ATP-binding protein [Streptococcus porcinus]VTT43849.1 glycine betaine ABC transporter ATP-binding protein [Streptococcus porcinus]VTT45225.1 glycine betaine ABC transporter ATP-binding protein [Streptococcus porcinus]